MQDIASRVSEIEKRAIEIIAELCDGKFFPHFETVISVLCQRYQVVDFSVLHVGLPSNVPSLHILHNIQSKLDCFLRVHLAVRSVVTLIDIDWECYLYLKSLCIPPILMKLNASNSDPCEVDLEDNDSDRDSDNEQQHALDSYTPESFECFGLGPIHRHPLLSCYFGIDTSLKDCCSSEQVMQLLLDYMSQRRQQQSALITSTQHLGNNVPPFDSADFAGYLCDQWSISNLSEVGVFLQGDLQAERLALQHSLNNRYRLFVEVTKKELVSFNQQMNSLSGGSNSTGRNSKRKRKRDLEIKSDNSVPVEDEVVGFPSANADADATSANTTVPNSVEIGYDGEEDNLNESSNDKNCNFEEVVSDKVPILESSDSVAVAADDDADATAAVDSMVTESDSKEQIDGAEDVNGVIATATSAVTATAANYAASKIKDNADIVQLGDGNVVVVAGRRGSDSVNKNSSAAVAAKAKAVRSCDMYEGRMTVFSPPSALAGHVVKGGCCEDEDIYTIENWELQAILPMVTSSSCTGSTNSTSGGNSGSSGGMDSREAGRWGECLVYQYLLSSSVTPGCVQWQNQIEESRAAYDFIVLASCFADSQIIAANKIHHSSTDHSCSSAVAAAMEDNKGLGRMRTEYIEVKTTRFADRNVFEISPFEWQFAAADSRVPYHIYRVFGAGDPAQVRILVIRDIYNRVLEGRIKLCMAV